MDPQAGSITCSHDMRPDAKSITSKIEILTQFLGRGGDNDIDELPYFGDKALARGCAAEN
jgi:hypothetical protein